MISIDENIGGFLREAFKSGHTSHAYIVVGERQQLPNLLQQCALVCMCQNHQGDNCEVCKKVLANLHQDVLWFPADREKSRLSVADMSLLVEECYKRPVDDGDCRVFLIDASNSVAGIASEVWQNKLLKTLEEPTDNIYIFLGVTDSEGLLPTIRSRCQVLKQTKLSVAEVCRQLQAKGYEKKFCEIAAGVSGGNVEAAEGVLATPSTMQAFQTALSACCSMTSTKNALKYVSAMLTDKSNTVWMLKFWTLLLRESIVYRLAPQLCVLPTFEAEIKTICQNYSLQAAEVCIEKINDAQRRIDDNGNLTVVIDQLVSSVLEVRFRCRV